MVAHAKEKPARKQNPYAQPASPRARPLSCGASPRKGRIPARKQSSRRKILQVASLTAPPDDADAGDAGIARVAEAALDTAGDA